MIEVEKIYIKTIIQGKNISKNIKFRKTKFKEKIITKRNYYIKKRAY